MSLATMKWWMEQSPEARAVFKEEPSTPNEACFLFHQWIQIHVGPVEGMWGNGSDFDNVILGGLFDAVGCPRPWSHSKNRCFRTIKNIALPKEVVQPVREGVHHNALDDAVYQTKVLLAAAKALNLRF